MLRALVRTACTKRKWQQLRGGFPSRIIVRIGEAILWRKDNTVGGSIVVCVETRLGAGPSEVRIAVGAGDLSLTPERPDLLGTGFIAWWLIYVLL